MGLGGGAGASLVAYDAAGLLQARRPRCTWTSGPGGGLLGVASRPPRRGKECCDVTSGVVLLAVHPTRPGGRAAGSRPRPAAAARPAAAGPGAVPRRVRVDPPGDAVAGRPRPGDSLPRRRPDLRRPLRPAPAPAAGHGIWVGHRDVEVRQPRGRTAGHRQIHDADPLGDGGLARTRTTGSAPQGVLPRPGHGPLRGNGTREGRAGRDVGGGLRLPLTPADGGLPRPPRPLRPRLAGPDRRRQEDGERGESVVGKVGSRSRGPHGETVGRPLPAGVAPVPPADRHPRRLLLPQRQAPRRPRRLRAGPRPRLRDRQAPLGPQAAGPPDGPPARRLHAGRPVRLRRRPAARGRSGYGTRRPARRSPGRRTPAAPSWASASGPTAAWWRLGAGI